MAGGNWNRQIDLPVSLGMLLGIEVFLTDYLSFFAEYALTLAYTNSFLSSSSADDETITNLTLLTDLGNSGKIGIVIYFEPAVKLSGQ